MKKITLLIFCLLLSACAGHPSLFHSYGVAIDSRTDYLIEPEPKTGALRPVLDTTVRPPQEESRFLKFSLNESIAIALANNRQLKIAREGQIKADGKIKEAAAGRYPSLTANLSYSRIDETTEFEISGRTVSIGDLNTYKSEASLKQTLYQGGKIAVSNESAQLNRQLAGLQFTDTEELVIFQTAKAYYEVLLNREILEVNRKSLAMATAHRDNVKALNQQGMSSDYELLRSEVQASNLKTLSLQSESNAKLAELNLLKIMGLPIDESTGEMELTERLSYTPSANPEALNFQDALATAFSQRADLKQARLTIEIQEKNITLARASLLPNLSLSFNTGYEKPSRKDFGVVDWGDYWNAGATVSFPLFEGGLTRSKLIQEKAVLQQHQITLRETEEKVRYEIRQSVLSLEDAEELLVSQKENVAQAAEGLRLAELGFRNGVNTQLEVMDAQMALDLARKNYLAAVYQYNVSELVLKKAVGGLKKDYIK